MNTSATSSQVFKRLIQRTQSALLAYGQLRGQAETALIKNI